MIMKRARNAHNNNKAKNSTHLDYKRSTAFEAVIGYLYLTKNFERMNLFLQMTVDEFCKEKGENL